MRKFLEQAWKAAVHSSISSNFRWNLHNKPNLCITHWFQLNIALSVCRSSFNCLFITTPACHPAQGLQTKAVALSWTVDAMFQRGTFLPTQFKIHIYLQLFSDQELAVDSDYITVCRENKYSDLEFFSLCLMENEALESIGVASTCSPILGCEIKDALSFSELTAQPQQSGHQFKDQQVLQWSLTFYFHHHQEKFGYQMIHQNQTH